MATKTFTNKQKEIVARKLGYDGPMSGFEKFVKSDPAMERKLNLLTSKFMAKGGMPFKEFAKGKLPFTEFAKGGMPLKFAEGGYSTSDIRTYVDALVSQGGTAADIKAAMDTYGVNPTQLSTAYPELAQQGIDVQAAYSQTTASDASRLKELEAAYASSQQPKPKPAETTSVGPKPDSVPTTPTVPVQKIGSAKTDELVSVQTPAVASTMAAKTAGEPELATTPTAVTAETIDAAKTKTAVDTVVGGNKAIVGALSAKAQATAAETKPAETALKDLEAAKLAKPREVAGVPERTLQSGELVSGPAVNQALIDAALIKAEAATAAVKPEMTVQGQLDKLLADFDAQNPPVWAASSMRSASAVLTARGMGASSLAGQAIIQATLEAALPIAVQDAQTVATLELQNLSNRQQMAVLTAQQRATFLGQEFDQAFQTKVVNAAKVSDIANINFTAEQTIAIENAKLAQTVDLANLSNEQALIMAKAAQMANLESANLDNRQKAALQNAQAFLQLDLTNLNNEQQTTLFNAEKAIQSIFTDAAAENAAKQFNASSKMQVQQFYDSLTAQVSQFNASQKNAMEQFNVSQENAVEQFNTAQKNSMEQFNAQNRLIVDQSNAEWRRQITLVDTGAINQGNQFDAQASLQVTMASYNNMWQTMRDQMEHAFTASENLANRNNTLAIAVLQKEATIEAAKFQIEAAKYEALGNLSASVLKGSDIVGSITGGAKSAIDAIRKISPDFGGTIGDSVFTDSSMDFLSDYKTFLETDENAFEGADYWAGAD